MKNSSVITKTSGTNEEMNEPRRLLCWKLSFTTQDVVSGSTWRVFRLVIRAQSSKRSFNRRRMPLSEFFTSGPRHSGEGQNGRWCTWERRGGGAGVMDVRAVMPHCRRQLWEPWAWWMRRTSSARSWWRMRCEDWIKTKLPICTLSIGTTQR